MSEARNSLSAVRSSLDDMKVLRLYRYSFRTDLSDLSGNMMAIEKTLEGLTSRSEDRSRALLLLEEVIVKLSEAAGNRSGGRVNVMVIKSLRRIRIRLSCKGSDAGIASMLSSSETFVLGEEYGDEVEEVIRGMILSSYSDRLSSRYSHGVNLVNIIVSQSDKIPLYNTLLAIGLGLFAGFLVKSIFSPETAASISGYAFLPLYKLFLTAVTMIVAPLVFFSMASSIGGFTDLRALGRTGGKVFGLYSLTTCMAIAVAFLFNDLFHPGRPGLIPLPESTGQEVAAITVSLKDTLMNIVPDNFLGAFVASDMMQVMFLAIVVGIAMGRMGKYSESVSHFIDSANNLFGTITAMLTKLLPFAVFGSIASMTVSLDFAAVKVLAKWTGACLCALLSMLFIYLLLLAVLGRLNPMKFIRKFSPATFTGFVTSSSNATMPTTMESCRRLGIAPKIYSFSIPLGANVNMDGTAIMFTLTTLFVAGLYGVTVEGSALASLVATIVMLSFAMPGVPGAGTACMVLLFSIVGIPPEAMSLVIGAIPLLELFMTAGNVTGDGVVSTIVARTEGALDLEKYNS